MTDELYEACRSAIHVVTREGQTLRAGRAALFVLGEIGWSRIARCCSLPPMVWCVELGYAILARNRKFFAGFMFRKEYPDDPWREGRQQGQDEPR
jgi:hypothetical protein